MTNDTKKAVREDIVSQDLCHYRNLPARSFRDGEHAVDGRQVIVESIVVTTSALTGKSGSIHLDNEAKKKLKVGRKFVKSLPDPSTSSAECLLTP